MGRRVIAVGLLLAVVASVACACLTRDNSANLKELAAVEITEY